MRTLWGGKGRGGGGTNRGEDELERDGGALGGRLRSLGSPEGGLVGLGRHSSSQLLLPEGLVCVLRLRVCVCVFVCASLSRDNSTEPSLQTIFLAIYMQSPMPTADWNAIAD